jgi:D-sedoheptulose 7-phosphate isomerase
MKKEISEKLIKMYLDEKKEVLNNFPIKEVAEAAEIVMKTYENKGTIYGCGNGGNAAYVSNMLTDFSMHPFVSDNKSVPMRRDVLRLKTYHLANEGSTLTAILNDIGPDDIFSQQLINNRISHKDLVIGFSGSGNSKNIVKAFDVAKNYGAKTLGITRGTGGKLKEISDLCIVIPGDSNFPGQTGGNNNNFHYEDALSSIPHMITGLVRKELNDYFGNKS